MNCMYCRHSHCHKRGQRNGKQRYQCLNCRRFFQDDYTYRAYNQEANKWITRLLKNSCGVLDISRILEIAPKTVLSRMLKISKTVRSQSDIPRQCEFEIDEMSIKIGNGQKQNWLIYGIEKQTKQIISFKIGRRTKKNIKQIMDKILALEPKKVFTDRLNIYPKLIPKEIHKRFPYCTNKIERMNLTLRTHIKRLSRKTICFSRKRKYLEAHLKIYFWADNNLSPTL
ncbi:MAG: IS1 family transposase [Nonlabens sp.]